MKEKDSDTVDKASMSWTESHWHLMWRIRVDDRQCQLILNPITQRKDPFKTLREPPSAKERQRAGEKAEKSLIVVV